MIEMKVRRVENGIETHIGATGEVMDNLHELASGAADMVAAIVCELHGSEDDAVSVGKMLTMLIADCIPRAYQARAEEAAQGAELDEMSITWQAAKPSKGG